MPLLKEIVIQELTMHVVIRVHLYTIMNPEGSYNLMIDERSRLRLTHLTNLPQDFTSPTP